MNAYYIFLIHLANELKLTYKRLHLAWELIGILLLKDFS